MRILIAAVAAIVVTLVAAFVSLASCGIDPPGCDDLLAPYQASAEDTGHPDARLVILADHTADAPHTTTPAGLERTVHELLDKNNGEGRVIVDIGMIQGRTDVNSFWARSNRVVRYRTDVPADRDSYVHKVAGCLDQWTTGLVPRVPDSSLLDALQKVGQQIGTRHGPVTVVALANGLDNTGPLDLRVPIAGDASTESVVDAVTAGREIPALKDVDVHVLGLGQTSEGKRQFSEGERNWLVDLWRKLLTKAGVTNPDLQQSVGPAADRPASEPPTDAPFSPAPPASPPVTESGRVSLSDQALFAPNSPALMLSSQAVLAPYLKSLLKRGATATITGHTASWGPIVGRYKLSTERAQAVADFFTSQQVPAAALTIRGVGSDDPAVDDLAANGALIEQNAQRNRRIVLDITIPSGG
ncbi:OmpA family protein [Amycolatopsis minnesotensis]|uniref:OmpA family protein n=1 Tax=Amycolatopsis minnesotensis TaxID=337894 RepID=UPI0031DD436B